MEDISISIEEKNGWSVLFLQGRLDRVNAEDVGSKAEETMATAAKMAADLSGLEYISSAGLRVLLSAQKMLNASGGAMKIVGANDIVKEIFEVTGFSDILTIE